MVEACSLRNPDFFCGEEVIPSWLVLRTEIFFLFISDLPGIAQLSKLALCLERKDLLLHDNILLIIAVF